MFRLLALWLAALPSFAAERPNILFLYTDDQAPWALGMSGHPYAKTPNLDKLFARGAYLPNSFTVTPVCSPSRAALLAGRYGAEVGITEWINPAREPYHGLAPGTGSFAEDLRRAGYRTGLVGKWHLGLLDEQHPTRFGYEYFMGFRGGGTTPDNPVLEKDGHESRFEGLTVDIVTDYAIQFIRQRRDGPFLLSVHYREPHALWLPVAPEDWAPFEKLVPRPPHPDYPNLDMVRLQRMTREYLASVASVDRNVGRILALLDELGIAGDTVVVYSSDHGYNMGHNGIWHKGNGHWVLTKNPPATPNVPEGQRPNMYDHSIRVPTAVVWPGTVKPGTRIEGTVSNLDWRPTLNEIAGAPAPAGEVLRGRSLVPLLRGEAKGWDDGLYAQYSTHHQSRTDMRMWRTPEWKLIRDFLDPARDELYDLKRDPEERRNSIGSRDRKAQAAVRELHAKILARMRETNDPVLAWAER